MSERASFVTEYMYCPKCFEAVKSVLISNDKFLKGVAIPSWEQDGKELPIVAGKIGGTYAGEPVHYMHSLAEEKIAPLICHPVTIAAIDEDGRAHSIRIEPEDVEPLK